MSSTSACRPRYVSPCSVPTWGPDFVTEGRSLILCGKTGRGKTHLAVAIGYRAIQNGFETFCTTAAELVEDLSNASNRGRLQESLLAYTRPHVLIIDEVGYLTYGPDAGNVLFHVVNDRHLRKRPMIFTTNKPLSEWGKVLHDEDLADAILDRILECGRLIHLDGSSGRTRHLKLEEVLPATPERARISGTHNIGCTLLRSPPFLTKNEHAGTTGQLWRQPEDHETRVTPTNKTLAQPQDGRRSGPVLRHHREPFLA